MKMATNTHSCMNCRWASWMAIQENQTPNTTSL